MALRVGLAYNLKRDCPGYRDQVEDIAAECEEVETVEGIVQALERGGNEVYQLPYGKGLLDAIQRQKIDIVFNIAEGWNGRNRESVVPAILEFAGIPYTGSDPLTLGMALDKVVAKKIAAQSGIRTPKFIKVSSIAELLGMNGRFNLKFPVFVKPTFEGSSKGIRNSSRVDSFDQLISKVEWITTVYREPALIEEFIGGREFTVGVLGNEELTVFPIMEVRPGPVIESSDKPFVYSYETKSGNLERFLCPAPLPRKLETQIRDMAVAVYRALECKDVGRVDIRLDESGKPYFLEINPLPGLSKVSLLPLQAAAAGISFDELVNRILELAWERQQRAEFREDYRISTQMQTGAIAVGYPEPVANTVRAR